MRPLVFGTRATFVNPTHVTTAPTFTTDSVPGCRQAHAYSEMRSSKFSRLSGKQATRCIPRRPSPKAEVEEKEKGEEGAEAGGAESDLSNSRKATLVLNTTKANRDGACAPGAQINAQAPRPHPSGPVEQHGHLHTATA